MKVQLDFECGEKTCASSPGEFCRFLGAKNLGTKPHCMLFDKELYEGTPEGWLLRCAECIKLSEDKL